MENIIKTFNNNRKKAFIIIALLCVIILALIVLLAFNKNNGDDSTAASTDEIVYSVQVLEARSTQESEFLTYAGIIQPDTTQEATFATIAEITHIHVKEGDFVTTGQKIVTIDDETASEQIDVSENAVTNSENAIETAQSNLTQAQIDLNSAIQTRDSNPDAIAAQNDVNIAKTDAADAQKDLDAINLSLQPFETAVTDAQAEYDSKAKALSDAQIAFNDATNAKAAAQTEYDTAVAEYNALSSLDDSDPLKIAAKTRVDNADIALSDTGTALTNATTALETAEDEFEAAETDLRTAQSQLFAEETRLGKSQVELRLQTANANVSTNEARYNSIIAQAQFEVDARTAEVDAAQIQYDSAVEANERAIEEHNNNLAALDDLTYYATAPGTVLMITGKVGSVATPLAPVVVIGSEGMVAEFGVSAQDVEKIKAGDNTKITVKGVEYAGQILEVAVIPDEETRTYLTRALINMAPDDLLIGELVSVDIQVGDSQGVWLPIQIILNDGFSYVFAVENGRAIRKDIEILQIDNDMVLVNGLLNGEMIISQGMKTIKSGYNVLVVE